MKKLCIILSLVLVFGLLASCTPAAESNSTAPPVSKAPVTDAPPADDNTPEPLEPATISFIPILSDLRDNQMVEDEVNRLLAEKYPEMNLTFDFMPLDWGTYPERLNIMLQTGEAFDIAFLCQWYPPGIGPVMARGDLMPLTDLLQEHGQGILDIVSNYAYFEALGFNGEIYGVPNEGGIAQTKGITFNADLVDKYGFDYKSVKTLADLEPFLQTIKENEPGIIPILPGFGASDLALPKDGDPEGVANHYSYDFDTDTLIGVYAQDKELEFANLMRDWYNKGYIAKDAASRIIWTDEMRSGMYAVMPNFAYQNDGIKSSEDHGFRCYDVPTYTASPIRAADIQNASVVISKSSTHPDRAMQMLNIIWTDKDILNTLVYGVEGFHWNFVDEAAMVIETTQEYIDGYNENLDYQIAGMYNMYGTTAGTTREKMVAGLENNKTAAASRLMGFSYDASGVETELAAVNAIVEEMSPQLLVGSVDPAVAIPALYERLEAAGWARLKDDLHAQITAWRAANGK